MGGRVSVRLGLNQVGQPANRSPTTTGQVYDVVETILALVHEDPIARMLILIGGCSQSGKSWLAETVKTHLTSVDVPCLIVKLDNWLVSLDQRRPRSTVMERYDCAAVTQDINLLLEGKPIYPPIYDARTRRRVCEKSSVPIRVLRGVLLVEGVIALALPEACQRAALRIFVDVDDSTRRTRLLSFYCGSKGVEPRDAERILREREGEEVPFVCGTRAWADLAFLNK